MCYKRSDWKFFEVLLVLMLDFLHTHNIVNDYLAGTPLMKQLRTCSGNIMSTSVHGLLVQKPYWVPTNATVTTNFFENCEKWRKRTCTTGPYSDIYDGKIWH